ncbi:CDGSH iron-sulfur domain-containing protein [Prosthecomicrobium sp. N25]|uniref:CDGSH iron-sulfur domain-containing protein n=1 Tax=Prosthecomicrobium sp. N25 TaxID=3129254 RepID=UPI0030783B70
MSAAVVAQKAPYPVEVKAGESYWWCACGRSANQPFCDGSHTGTGITPVEWVSDKDGKAFFCGCKATQKPTMCDGSHKAL